MDFEEWIYEHDLAPNLLHQFSDLKVNDRVRVIDNEHPLYKKIGTIVEMSSGETELIPDTIMVEFKLQNVYKSTALERQDGSNVSCHRLF
jgi:hypothetical protein